MSDREDFEAAYAKRAKCKITDLIAARWGSNGYRDPFAASAWFGFIDGRAARTAPAEPVAWVDIPPGDQQAGWYPGYKFEGLSNLEPGKYHLYLAPDALQAEGTRSDKYRAELYDEVFETARDMGYGNVTDALVALERLNQARAALHADNERLREELEQLQSENQSLLMQCTGMGNSIDELKRSVQNEVNRRNQYAMESGELDRQVEALTNSNKACEDCFAELMAESKRLVAERDSLKADAERYRWARSKHRIQDAICFELDSDAETDLQMDEAVDAEIARTAKPEVDHE